MTRTRTARRGPGRRAAHFVRQGLPQQVWQTLSLADKKRKMRSFWSLSLQSQLAIAIGLVLVPVLAAAIWSGMSTFRERATELGDQTRVVAFTTAAYINRDLTNLDGTERG